MVREAAGDSSVRCEVREGIDGSSSSEVEESDSDVSGQVVASWRAVGLKLVIPRLSGRTDLLDGATGLSDSNFLGGGRGFVSVVGFRFSRDGVMGVLAIDSAVVALGACSLEEANDPRGGTLSLAGGFGKGNSRAGGMGRMLVAFSWVFTFSMDGFEVPEL